MTTATLTPQDSPATTDDVAALYERHAPSLYRYCLSLLHDPDAAADAAQQAWLRTLERTASPAADVRSFRAWLFTVARNECFDVYSRGRREAAAPIADDTLGGEDGADEVLERREELRTLLADLGAVSERQRRAIALRVVDGLPYGQVAGSLDTSVDRARDLVCEARQVLNERRSGRAESCEQIRLRIDRRRGAGHGLRAHLEQCQACNLYELQARRRTRLLAFSPIVLIRLCQGRLLSLWSRTTTAAGPLPSPRSTAAVLAAALAVGIPLAPHVIGGHRPGAKRAAITAPDAPRDRAAHATQRRSNPAARSYRDRSAHNRADTRRGSGRGRGPAIRVGGAPSTAVGAHTIALAARASSPAPGATGQRPVVALARRTAQVVAGVVAGGRRAVGRLTASALATARAGSTEAASIADSGAVSRLVSSVASAGTALASTGSPAKP